MAQPVLVATLNAPSLKGRREKFYIANKSMSRDYESMKKDIEISL